MAGPPTPSPDYTDYQWYGYDPSLAVGLSFLIFFSLSTLVHVYQMWTSKMWWLVVLFLGGITEIIGYSARVYSHYNDTDLNAFLAQTVTLIIAPAFFSAALYVVFGRIIMLIGEEYSILRPMWYTIIFVIADVISLVVQAIGGAGASTAAKQHTHNDSGTHIMVGGICFQMFSMACFVILVIIYIVRIYRAKLKLTRRMQWFLFGMGIVTLMIFIRCIYRTIELLGGWKGYIITHEIYFALLDGLPMALVLLSFNIWHPSYYLNEPGLVDDAVATITSPSQELTVAKKGQLEV